MKLSGVSLLLILGLIRAAFPQPESDEAFTAKLQQAASKATPKEARTLLKSYQNSKIPLQAALAHAFLYEQSRRLGLSTAEVERLRRTLKLIAADRDLDPPLLNLALGSSSEL